MRRKEEVLVIVEELCTAGLIEEYEVEKAKEFVERALKKIRVIKFKEKSTKN